MTRINSQLAIPTLSPTDNAELLQTIKAFLADAPSTLSTHTLSQYLSKALVHHFIRNDLTLTLALYDQQLNLETAFGEEVACYVKHVISFAFKDALYSAYTLPIINFFNSEFTSANHHTQQLQYFALKKLAQSLACYNNDYEKIYAFIRQHFLSRGNAYPHCPTLHIQYFMHYRTKLNRLPHADPALAMARNVFNAIINRMQADVSSLFQQTLNRCSYHYPTVLTTLHGQLYDDVASKQACKNMLFDYLFTSPHYFNQSTEQHIDHLKQLAIKSYLYLECIADQITRWQQNLKTDRSNKKAFLPLAKMQEVIKHAKENTAYETYLEALGTLITIAARARPAQAFLTAPAAHAIEIQFYDVIARFYTLFAELNYLPELGSVAKFRG